MAKVLTKLTKAEILKLIAAYERHDPALYGVAALFPKSGKRDMALQWLFFSQGVVFRAGLFSIVELETHLRERSVPEPRREHPKTAYVVEYVEVEFGQRPEGFVCFLSHEDAVARAKRDSEANDASGGYYCGPVRPVLVTPIPWDQLPGKVASQLLRDGIGFTDRTWRPTT